MSFLDFMGNFAAVLITAVVVLGFVAIAAVAVFELASMLVFWWKNSLRRGPRGPLAPLGLISAR